jgi:hypothetical protein
MNKRPLWALGILSFLPLMGCLGNLFGGNREPMVEGKNGSIALSKLERYVDNFADREVVIVSEAADAIERDCCTTATQRSLAHRLKTLNAAAIYDIVTSPNPLGHIVDLYVMINLQALVWMDEGLALKLFGERGRAHAAAALEATRREISRIADLAIKPDRKADLDKKILEWRRKNPEARFVSMVRFGNLPDASGMSPLEALGSLFDVLNPLDETAQKVENTEKMAERVFFYAKRLPQMATWQAETALAETMASPEISRLTEGVSQTSGSVERVTKVVEILPQTIATERKEILAAWDAREGKLGSTVKEIHSTVSEAKDLAGKITEATVAGKSLAAEANELAKTVDLVLKDLAKLNESAKNAPPGEPGKPFNISEYAAAAVEFTQLVREVNLAIRESHTLLESPVWQRRQEDVNQLTQQAVGHAGARGKEWVDHLMLRVGQVLVVFFVLLVLYRAVMHRILRPRPEARD